MSDIGIVDVKNSSLCEKKKHNIQSETSTMVTKFVPIKSSITTCPEAGQPTKKNCRSDVCKTKGSSVLKTKRKRRRGKPKLISKINRISNWRFQARKNRNVSRSKYIRNHSIVPYNTNRFLMEEHMAEVPSAAALLTPSGRTRDSSFSVDSEDNYFFSLPEDEEEFLTKEFANVYEKARVERLENLTKQQLIEECLQLEDRYAQNTGSSQNGCNDYLNRIRLLEERVRDLNTQNMELRRQLGQVSSSRLCSNSSEDSESDSSSSSSSCDSTEYSGSCQQSCGSYLDAENDAMDSDEPQQLINKSHVICNGFVENNGIKTEIINSSQTSPSYKISDSHKT